MTTEIENAVVAAEMLEGLRMTGLSSCEVQVYLANAESQIFQVSYKVADATSEEMDDISYEAWLQRIEAAIIDANAQSKFNLDRVLSIAVRFKCRPTSQSTYQVECTDLRSPYWNRFVLRKNDGPSRIYARVIKKEDSLKLCSINQIKDMMCDYYSHQRMRRVKSDLPYVCLQH